MENNNDQLQSLITYLATELSSPIHVTIEGLLGVVKVNGYIVFTTSGLQSNSVIEAFLNGMVFVVEWNKKLKLNKS